MPLILVAAMHLDCRSAVACRREESCVRVARFVSPVGMGLPLRSVACCWSRSSDPARASRRSGRLARRPSALGGGVASLASTPRSLAHHVGSTATNAATAARTRCHPWPRRQALQGAPVFPCRLTSSWLSPLRRGPAALHGVPQLCRRQEEGGWCVGGSAAPRGLVVCRGRHQHRLVAVRIGRSLQRCRRSSSSSRRVSRRARPPRRLPPRRRAPRPPHLDLPPHHRLVLSPLPLAAPENRHAVPPARPPDALSLRILRLPPWVVPRGAPARTRGREREGGPREVAVWGAQRGE